MSHVIGEVAGVTVGMFAGGQDRGQMIQLTVDQRRMECGLAHLTPGEALRLCGLIANAVGQAAGLNQLGPLRVSVDVYAQRRDGAEE